MQRLHLSAGTPVIKWAGNAQVDLMAAHYGTLVPVEEELLCVYTLATLTQSPQPVLTILLLYTLDNTLIRIYLYFCLHPIY